MESAPEWKGAVLGDGSQGGTSSSSKLSRQFWYRMDMSCAAPETCSLGIGPGNGSGEMQIHPERFSADSGWAGATFFLSSFEISELQELAIFLRKDVGGFLQLLNPQIT